jgi:hypothetical protein
VAGIKVEPADAVIAAEITPTDEDLPHEACSVKIHHLSIEEAYSSIQSAPSGLSSDEARRRLSEYGRNEVEKVSR